MRYLFKLFFVMWFATPIAASSATIDTIQERGELRIGVSIFAPWTYTNSEGHLAGHEIDLGNSIASDLGVEAHFVIYNFEEVFDALENEEIDMIAAGVAMTPERARRFHFSIPYMSTGVNIATQTSAFGEGTTVAQLNNPEVTVAVVEDTLAERIANSELGDANIVRFSTASGAEGAVIAGRAQAYVASVPENRIFALRRGGAITLPLDDPLVAGVSGFVVRQEDDQVLHFLNSWIHMREVDGFIADRHRQYFDTLDWAVDMVQQ